MNFRMKREDVVNGIVKLGATGREFVKQAKEIGMAAAEHGVMECNGKLLEELLNVFDNRFSGALQAWFSQKGVPFTVKDKHLTFSARKAEGIAKDIKAVSGPWTCDPSKLSGDDRLILEKICISAIATLNATEWDKTLAASRREAREAAAANPESAKKSLEKALKKALDLGVDVSGILPAGTSAPLPDALQQVVTMLEPFGDNAPVMAAIVRAIGMTIVGMKDDEEAEPAAAA